MKSSWEKKAGHLTCQWSELGQRSRYNEPWMKTSHIFRVVTSRASSEPVIGIDAETRIFDTMWSRDASPPRKSACKVFPRSYRPRLTIFSQLYDE
jgi:hypothetical protein